MVLISAPLVGFSFIQAVRMYSQSSSNAFRLPQLLPNVNLLDGIIIPTFGAVYLMNTFLLPFVAIRAIGNEKQTGALKIALQLPIGMNRLVGLKLAALAVGWCIALAPTLSALAIWALLLGRCVVALSVGWLPPGVSRRQKLVRSGAVFGVAAQALLLVIQLPIFADVSENQRNSFNPADMRELRQMAKELKVNVNLAANDSRLADLDRNILSKLPRAIPHEIGRASCRERGDSAGG